MIQIKTSNYLDSILKDFFPKEGIWRNNCFDRDERILESNLPCHLRNIDWLTSLIVKKYDLSSLGEDIIKEYIRNSSYFNQLRSEYEQRIIKWQINWMMNDGNNWIVDSDFYLFSPMCDYMFRKGIVDTLSAIGMNIDAIEEGIEKNADIWRNSHMNLAFYNEFYPVNHYLLAKQDDEKLEEPNSEFKEAWLKYRKYQYYQEHKESVDKYGTPTPEMLITPEEAKKLALSLEKMSLERYQEIEEYNKRKELSLELKKLDQERSNQLSYQKCIPGQKDRKTTKQYVKELLSGILK